MIHVGCDTYASMIVRAIEGDDADKIKIVTL